MTTDKARTVFVIHGRNLAMRDALYRFLRSLDLTPLPFEEAADRYVQRGAGPAYVGEVVRLGLEVSQAMIALVTADELVSTHPALRSRGEPESRWAARPNVWFEAGMAFQLAPERMIVAIEPGAELPTDVAGIQYFRVENSTESRRRLRARLQAVQCAIDVHSELWRDHVLGGDFDAATYPRPQTKSPW